MRWVTIWCIGSRCRRPRQGRSLATALGAGADAFLARPVSMPISRARLAHATQPLHGAAGAVSPTGRRKYLQAYFEAAEDENKAARVIMDQLLRLQFNHDGVLQT